MATTVSRLAQIDAAIEALLTGGATSYSIGDRSVTKLDLADLLEERRFLLNLVDRESGGSMKVAKFRSISQ